jgi:hypothetical protein
MHGIAHPAYPFRPARRTRKSLSAIDRIRRKKILLTRAFELPLTALWAAADQTWASAETARTLGENTSDEVWLVTRSELATARWIHLYAFTAAVLVLPYSYHLTSDALTGLRTACFRINSNGRRGRVGARHEPLHELWSQRDAPGSPQTKALAESLQLILCEACEDLLRQLYPDAQTLEPTSKVVSKFP